MFNIFKLFKRCKHEFMLIGICNKMTNAGASIDIDKYGRFKCKKCGKEHESDLIISRHRGGTNEYNN